MAHQFLTDVERFQRADIDFHLAIARASRNHTLMNVLLLIKNLVQNWIGSTLRVEGVTAKALEQHQQIFVAVAKKNQLAARSAVQNHLRDMANFLLKASKAHNGGALISKPQEEPAVS